MTSQDVVALLVPVVTAVLGVLGITWQDRRVRRSAGERQRIGLEDAIRRLTFTTQWLQARQSLEIGNERRQQDEQLALRMLDDAYTTAQSTGQAEAAEDTRPLVSRLFLLYRMTRVPAKLVRVAFYLSVAYVGWIALVALDEVLSGVTYADQASWEVTGSIIGVLVALAFRGWALALDSGTEDDSRPQSDEPNTP